MNVLLLLLRRAGGVSVSLAALAVCGCSAMRIPEGMAFGGPDFSGVQEAGAVSVSWKGKPLSATVSEQGASLSAYEPEGGALQEVVVAVDEKGAVENVVIWGIPQEKVQVME